MISNPRWGWRGKACPSMSMRVESKSSSNRKGSVSWWETSGDGMARVTTTPAPSNTSRAFTTRRTSRPLSAMGTPRSGYDPLR